MDTAPFDLILVALDRDARVVAERLGEQPGLNDNVPVLVFAEDAESPHEGPKDGLISGPLTVVSLIAGMVKALHWTAGDQVDDAA